MGYLSGHPVRSTSLFLAERRCVAPGRRAAGRARRIRFRVLAESTCVQGVGPDPLRYGTRWTDESSTQDGFSPRIVRKKFADGLEYHHRPTVKPQVRPAFRQSSSVAATRGAFPAYRPARPQRHLSGAATSQARELLGERREQVTVSR